MTPSLFEPLSVGAWTLPNRIIMAPLTRCRASAGRVPNATMAEYYRQRSSAGLIISEATSIDPMGVGYPDTPGIWSEAQVDGWKLVTEAVHAAGGRILLQLWHVGRLSDPIYLDGKQPVAPSPIAPPPEAHISLVRPQKGFVTPRALERDEIFEIIEHYRLGAKNAQQAGFDGVELHGANGYLLDQFLQDSTNQRTDDFGGSVENRARLMLAAVDAAISVWGASRVGLHLAPRGDAHWMHDSDPATTFGYVAEQMAQRQIAFLFARESTEEPRLGSLLKKKFGGIYIVNEGVTRTAADELLAKGEADAIGWGKMFIANPDLPKRLMHDGPYNPPRPELFYAAGAEGYTDYPALES